MAARYEALWWELMAALDVERPDVDPHATAYVDDMVTLIGDLVAEGHAYVGGDGVYFSTESVPGYGLLARQDLDTLRAGARVEAGDGGGQALPARFRRLEAAKAGRTGVALALGAGPPGLAHRVRRHVARPSG